MADLLFDFGNLLAVTLTAEHALAMYDLALRYRPARRDLVETRVAHLKTVVADRATQTLKRLGALVAVVLAGGLVFLLVRRLRARPATA